MNKIGRVREEKEQNATGYVKWACLHDGIEDAEECRAMYKAWTSNVKRMLWTSDSSFWRAALPRCQLFAPDMRDPPPPRRELRYDFFETPRAGEL